MLMQMLVCVCIYAGDGIYEPFEPELNYSTFGVRVAEASIPSLHDILASIRENEYARKQVRCQVCLPLKYLQYSFHRDQLDMYQWCSLHL